jgi:DNA-binding LytR/AlgR family response regulator
MPNSIQSIKCLIIDDEPLAQDIIQGYLLKYGHLKLINKVGSAIAAFEILHKEDIDVIFLDINMPVVDGLSFIKSLKHPPKVIFTTAYAEYALEAFDLDVVDYLLKPISMERFDKAIQKLTMHLTENSNNTGNIINTAPLPVETNRKDYFFVKVDGKLVKLKFDDILYIEGMRDYLKIITHGKPLIVHSTFKQMEEQLVHNSFMRVHKSYLVNIDAIKAVDGNMIILTNEQTTIPIGNMYKDQVFKLL